MRDWAGERVGLVFIPSGQPWRNDYVESFNGRLRDECLNINVFWSLTQTWVVISEWKANRGFRVNDRQQPHNRASRADPRHGVAVGPSSGCDGGVR
ncbi:transposase InsO family protein [Kutzneria viridogrisea]|uniref:Transposase InsO family protein n=1 Tax=Kutzneria viridogrisea TaxID=47990 RepID=A0ABR6BKH9_9PSEU|nr:transposase InsO family protein [Kutzneria viridogrisea]